MNIDSAEMTTIRMIRPSATPTILRRIDWLNSENDFTTSRIDRGDAGEAETACFNCKSCATNRNIQHYAVRQPRSTGTRGRDAAHPRRCAVAQSVADLDQATAPSPWRHDA